LKISSSVVAASLALLCAMPAAAQRSAGRIQIFSESFSMTGRGPYIVRLDSGVTYRMITEGTAADVSITPRSASGSPIRFSSSSVTGNGVPFEAPVTGEFRVETTYSGRDVFQVRIFRELRPAEECANPNRSGCSLPDMEIAQESGHHKISPAVLVMLGLFPAFIFGVMRNGKSF
jgi:hypothetical protein